MISPNEALVPGKSVTFIGKVDPSPNNELSYEWTFSGGGIIKGQGTSEIEFAASDYDHGSNITATVKILGLPKNCSNIVSHILPVIRELYVEPIDRFGKLSKNDERARLQNFFYFLSQEAAWEGVVILRFDKKVPTNKRIKRIARIINSIKFLKYDITRITFMTSEDKPEETVFFAFAENSEFFKDLSKEYKTLKAEEFKQKIKDLFPKK